MPDLVGRCTIFRSIPVTFSIVKLKTVSRKSNNERVSADEIPSDVRFDREELFVRCTSRSINCQLACDSILSRQLEKQPIFTSIEYTNTRLLTFE